MEEGMFRIDGEEYFVTEILYYGYLPEIRTDGPEFLVAESHETAGEAARKYWEELAQDDPQEFTCIVGAEALIAWGLGQSYAPGSIGVNNLEEWLDLHLDVPEEHWGTWDGQELEITDVSPEIIEELGFIPTVAYRQ